MLCPLPHYPAPRHPLYFAGLYGLGVMSRGKPCTVRNLVVILTSQSEQRCQPRGRLALKVGTTSMTVPSVTSLLQMKELSPGRLGVLTDIRPTNSVRFSGRATRRFPACRCWLHDGITTEATQRIEIPLESLRSVLPLAISTSCAMRVWNPASGESAAACIST